MKSRSLNVKSLFTKSLLAGMLLASCLTLLSFARPARAQYHVDPVITQYGGYLYGYEPQGDKYFAFNRTNDVGTVDFELYNYGTYSVRWDNITGEFTCGLGWNPGIYNRTINYYCSAYQNDNGGSFGAYGWTKSPNLCEYYVNEIWGPSPPTGDENIGTVDSDYGTYDNYHTYTFGPTIEGDKNFDQYVSNRRGQNTLNESHSIDMATHFDAWQSWANPRQKNVPKPDSDFDFQILLTEGYLTNSNPASGNCTATVW